MCEFGSVPRGSPSFEPFAFSQARTTQTPELKIPRSIPPAPDPHSHISGAVGFFPFPPTLPRRDQLLPCAPARPHTASHQRVLDTSPGVCPFHEPPGEQGWNRGSQHPQEQRIHPEPSVCSRKQELHFGMRICLQARAVQEQSKAQNKREFWLWRVGASPASESTNCVGSKGKQERDLRAGTGFWQLPAAPSDPGPAQTCPNSAFIAGILPFTKMQLESHSPMARAGPSRAASAPRALALHPHPGRAPKPWKRGGEVLVCPAPFLFPHSHLYLPVSIPPCVSHVSHLTRGSFQLLPPADPPGWASSHPQLTSPACPGDDLGWEFGILGDPWG